MCDMFRKNNICIFVGLFLSFIISEVIVAIVDTVCTKKLLLRSDVGNSLVTAMFYPKSELILHACSIASHILQCVANSSTLRVLRHKGEGSLKPTYIFTQSCRPY